ENLPVLVPPGKVGQAVSLPNPGEQLLTDRACTACHKLGDRDGGVAPDLSYEGLIRDDAWVMEHFRNPRSRMPDSIMPSFRFPDGSSHRRPPSLVSRKPPPPAMSPADTYRALCERCHGEKGDGNGKVAWYLDPSPRDFTKAAFMNSKPRDRFVAAIRDGVAG